MELIQPPFASVTVDLSYLGLICISGSDAQSFLQGQLSCDIRTLDTNTATYGGYCTPKGRLLSSFLIWRGAENTDYWLQLPVNLVQPMIKRLSMFVMRAKVVLQDKTDALVRIGIVGRNAMALLNECLTEITPTLHTLSVLHTDKGQVIRHSDYRVEIITTPAQANTTWEQCKRVMTPAETDCWKWQEICEGIPTIQIETQEAFIPQMINLDKIGGVSFQKGCYPGQEIVARTQYLGKLKKRLYRAYIKSSNTVAAGDLLYSEDMEQQASGMIINAAPAFSSNTNGGSDVLAVIQISSAATHEIHWQTTTGPVLKLLPLPYSVE